MLTLAEWRRAKNISQEEMAQACDVHINTYRRWEEEPSSIKIKYVGTIAKRLGVKQSEIIF
jgi:transcriptional regulator with XRE-family HTH domain